MEGIEFDDYYYSSDFNETEIYFSAPVNFINRVIYPEAISAEICITFEGKDPPDSVEYCDVTISPTKQNDDQFEDYDWDYYEITQEQYGELIDVFMKNSR